MTKDLPRFRIISLLVILFPSNEYEDASLDFLEILNSEISSFSFRNILASFLFLWLFARQLGGI